MRHKANQYFRARSIHGPETMPMSRIVKKPCSIFKAKRLYRDEDRPADIRLKMTFSR